MVSQKLASGLLVAMGLVGVHGSRCKPSTLVTFSSAVPGVSTSPISTGTVSIQTATGAGTTSFFESNSASSTNAKLSSSSISSALSTYSTLFTTTTIDTPLSTTASSTISTSTNASSSGEIVSTSTTLISSVSQTGLSTQSTTIKSATSTSASSTASSTISTSTSASSSSETVSTSATITSSASLSTTSTASQSTLSTLSTVTTSTTKTPVCVPGQETNVLQNPSFESASASPWQYTSEDEGVSTGDVVAGTDMYPAADGKNYFNIIAASDVGSGVLYQTFTTIPDVTQYKVSFQYSPEDVQNMGSTHCTFQIQINDQTLPGWSVEFTADSAPVGWWTSAGPLTFTAEGSSAKFALQFACAMADGSQGDGSSGVSGLFNFDDFEIGPACSEQAGYNTF